MTDSDLARRWSPWRRAEIHGPDQQVSPGRAQLARRGDIAVDLMVVHPMTDQPARAALIPTPAGRQITRG